MPWLQVGKLDRLLTWLWRVHGVDYYAGTEVAEPDEEQRAGPRPTLRCPRPEEGEQASRLTQEHPNARSMTHLRSVSKRSIALQSDRRCRGSAAFKTRISLPCSCTALGLVL